MDEIRVLLVDDNAEMRRSLHEQLSKQEGLRVAGECANWRGWEEDRTRYNMGDNGKAFSRRFYDWGLEKYGSHEALTKAWNQPNLSRENVEMPSTERRESLWQNTADFFRDSPDAQLCMDIEDFFSHCTATALDSFGKVAKDASGGKAVGAFYKELVASGIPASAALEMTKDYMTQVKNIVSDAAKS